MIRLFVDQLTNVDFSYLCPERGLLGETWFAHIELEGKLDHQGMICDFGTVKKTCRQWLDDMIDHRLLVPSAYTGTTLATQQARESVTFSSAKGVITCVNPADTLTPIPTQAITKESVAQWCEQQLRGLFGETVKAIHLRFSEEPIDGPFYHYSHGLKKHLGNCQRIAHGHRSKVLIWRGGNLDLGLMEEWSTTWQDIYIATRDDLRHSDTDFHHFEYQSQQGTFSLSLPKDCCYFIDTDSTVEHLAQHIADTLASKTGDSITVKAFEGAHKGAIASAEATSS